jgi:hypothetical protein
MQSVAAPGGLPSALATSRGCGYSGGRGYGSSDRANSRGRGRGRPSRGGHSGRGSTNKSSRPQCQVCLKFGHTANQCWHRFEEDYAPEQCTTAATSSFGIDNNRYTNSGATNHITGDLDKLTMHDRYAGADQVHAANRIGMTISRIGKTIIPTPCRDLVLKDVLHVPSTHKNLILVHHFTLDNDTFIEFHPYFFLIKDQKMRKVLQHGPCKCGLYPLPLSSSKYCKLVFSVIKLSAAIWHIRLGHPARDIVRRVMSTNNLPGFICFALNLRFSNTSLSFQCLVECQFGRKILAVQSNWGREYEKLNSFFYNISIAHQVSCPHTHQQNGNAEWKHRHIVEMGLSILAHASMPLKYWDEAFLVATYIINLIPTKVLAYDTPIHKLLGATPDYSSFRVFGCACWPNLRSYNSHKLQLRSTRCAFLGYSNMHKGYKCLDISTGRIYISQDVIFDESIFPFASLHFTTDARYHSDVLLTPATTSDDNNFTNAANMITLPILPVYDSYVQVPAATTTGLELGPSPGANPQPDLVPGSPAPNYFGESSLGRAAPTLVGSPDFQTSPDFQKSLLLNHLSDEDVLILARNIPKLSTTFV